MTLRILFMWILLVASLFFGLCSMGAAEAETGERCVILSGVFLIAFISLNILNYF